MAELKTGIMYMISCNTNEGKRFLEAFPNEDFVRPRPLSQDQKDQYWFIEECGEFYKIGCFTNNGGPRFLEAFPDDDVVRPRCKSSTDCQLWFIESHGGFYKICCFTSWGSRMYLQALPEKDVIRTRYSDFDEQFWEFTPYLGMETSSKKKGKNDKLHTGIQYKISCETNMGKYFLEAFPNEGVVRPRFNSSIKDQIWQIKLYGFFYKISCATKNGGLRFLEASTVDNVIKPCKESSSKNQLWFIESCGELYKIGCFTENSCVMYLQVCPEEDLVRPMSRSSDKEQLWEFTPLNELSNEEFNIFISYSWDDDRATRNLFQELTSAGFKCWMDKTQLEPGDDLIKEIVQAIDASEIFIACLSTSYLESRTCDKEFMFAYNSKKKIIPLIFGKKKIVEKYGKWPPAHKIFFCLADAVYVSNLHEDLLGPAIENRTRIKEFIEKLHALLNL